MKIKIKQRLQNASYLFEFLVVIAIIAILAAVLIPSRLKAQPTPGTTVYQPNFYTTVSNYNSLLVPSNGVMVLFGPATNQLLTLRQNQGDAFIYSLTTTNNSVGSNTIFFDVTADGVSNHWTGAGTNSHFLSFTTPLPNSNTIIVCINFTRDQLNNLRSVFPTGVSNSCSTNNVTINWLQESHGN